MSDFAISCENLGKKYRIGQRESYKVLRDTLTDVFHAPFRRLRANLHGNNGRQQGVADNTFWALKGISFDVRHGEVIGVIGRNGAGKSTLLKILSRVTNPTEGGARINGRVGSLLEVGTGFHPELTGRENIYLNGAILGMRKTEVERKFDEIVAFAEVEQFIDTPVKRYSSGMYTRLAFAVAAHMETEVLIVDEVLAVGDAGFQKKCLSKMGNVAKGGRTVLFVSHSIAAINELCHTAMLLDAGRVVLRGPTKEVTAAYLARTEEDRPVVTFQNRASKGLKFRTISIHNHEGKPTTQLDVRHSFSITLEYDVLTHLKIVEQAIRIRTFDGISVCTNVYSESTEGAVLERRPGRYRSQISVPGLFLMPGAYSVVAAAFVPNGEMLDVDFDSLRFEVVDTGTDLGKYGNYRELGLVLINTPWREEDLLARRSSDGDSYR